MGAAGVVQVGQAVGQPGAQVQQRRGGRARRGHARVAVGGARAHLQAPVRGWAPAAHPRQPTPRKGGLGGALLEGSSRLARGASVRLGGGASCCRSDRSRRATDVFVQPEHHAQLRRLVQRRQDPHLRGAGVGEANGRHGRERAHDGRGAGGGRRRRRGGKMRRRARTRRRARLLRRPCHCCCRDASHALSVSQSGCTIVAPWLVAAPREDSTLTCRALAAPPHHAATAPWPRRQHPAAAAPPPPSAAPTRRRPPPAPTPPATPRQTRTASPAPAPPASPQPAPPPAAS